MPTTETGAISRPMAILEDMLANSSNFQGLVGAADDTEARVSIHHFRDTEASTLPNAVIMEERATGWRPVSVNGDTHIPSGVLMLMFQAAIDSDDLDDEGYPISVREILVKLGNAVGAIMEDLLLASSQPGGLVIQADVETSDEGVRNLDAHDTHESNVAQAAFISYSIPWGG